MSSRTGPSRAGKSGLSRISDMAKILKMDAGIIRYVANLAGIEIVRADNGINKAVRVEDRERLKVICIKFKEQMATMTQGTSTGVLDEFLSPICVGDEIGDKAGTHYTIDRFGDQELADELRRRGYEVTATKTTIVEL